MHLFAAFDPDNARIAFILAIILFTIVGIAAIVEHSILQGIAWISAAIATLGFYWLTP